MSLVEMTRENLAAMETKIREIVATNPTFTYPYKETALNNPCYYRADNHEGKPRCLIGQAYLDLFGEEIPEEHEGSSFGQLFDLSNSWPDIVQAWQDKGKPWVECVAKADDPNNGATPTEFP